MGRQESQEIMSAPWVPWPSLSRHMRKGISGGIDTRGHPRDSVNQAVQASEEFRSLCPASAIRMAKVLTEPPTG